MINNRVKYLLISLLLSFSISAFLNDMPVKLVQPDGSILECFITGDEFYGRMHDSNDYTIVQSFSDGYYYYAKNENGRVLPTSYRADQAISSELLTPNIRISQEEYQFRRNKYFQNRSSRDAPTIGTINNINIFIRFADEEEFIFPRSSYDWQFNDEDGPSLNHYFLEASNGLLEVNTSHYPECDMDTNLSYQDEHPRSYYQLYNEQANPNGYYECPSYYYDEINCDEIDSTYWRSYREHALLKNAVDFIEEEVPDDLDVDANDDGYVDNVTFLVNGSPNGWAELLWPHRWSLYLYDAYIHDALVDGYNFNLSSGGYYTVGVLSHEFGHSLGCPDYYRYYDDSITPVGEWDIMAWNTSPNPQYPSAWTQYRYFNWIDCPIIDQTGTYELNALTDHFNHCYLVESPNSDSEHFVLEYRKNVGMYDANLPGNSNGMVIYRINLDINRNNIIDTLENEGGWPVGGNATGPPDEMYVYRPAGTLETNGNISAAIYSTQTGSTQINDSTSPSSFLSDGMPGGLNISEIGFPSTTISFKCDIECTNSVEGDVNVDSIVDILDIILMVNFILEFEYESCSDVNQDGILNILDVITIVNIIIED